MDDIFPYNAGIMLMNMPYLRQTNKQFIDWILEQRNGLYFDGALPVGAGGRGGCSAVSQNSIFSFLLSKLSWLSGAGYGPLDQGAINQFYEKEIKGKPISKVRTAWPPPPVLLIRFPCCLDAGLQCQALSGVSRNCTHCAPAWVRPAAAPWFRFRYYAHCRSAYACPQTPCPPSFRVVQCRPKPNHYLQWLRTGICVFGDICRWVSGGLDS